MALSYVVAILAEGILIHLRPWITVTSETIQNGRTIETVLEAKTIFSPQFVKLGDIQGSSMNSPPIFTPRIGFLPNFSYQEA